jgi:zinc finger CCHC domain-containing protein 9
MTRITNFGIKRTYVEAGLSSNEKSVSEPTEPQEAVPRMEDSIARTGDVGQPPKKKRKRTKMSKRDGNPGKIVGEERENGVGEVEDEGKCTASAAGDAERDAASTNHTSAKSKKKKQGKDRRQKGSTFVRYEIFISFHAFQH